MTRTFICKTWGVSGDGKWGSMWSWSWTTNIHIFLYSWA